MSWDALNCFCLPMFHTTRKGRRLRSRAGSCILDLNLNWQDLNREDLNLNRQDLNCQDLRSKWEDLRSKLGRSKSGRSKI